MIPWFDIVIFSLSRYYANTVLSKLGHNVNNNLDTFWDISWQYLSIANSCSKTYPKNIDKFTLVHALRYKLAITIAVFSQDSEVVDS